MQPRQIVQTQHDTFKLCLGNENETKGNSKFEMENNTIKTDIFKHNQTMRIMSARKALNRNIPKPIRKIRNK